MRLPHPPLLLVTDRTQARAPLHEVVEAALAAGCRWISLREKDLSAPEQIALARTLLRLARSHNAILTLHGDPSLAVAAALDGVHISAQSDAAAARTTLGPERLLGVSVHSAQEAAALEPARVDYAIAGPVFLTASKPGYGPALEPRGIVAIAAASRVPLLAIGGIEPDNAADLLAAGAAGVAVMGGVMRAPDPGAEIARLLLAFRTVRGGNSPRIPLIPAKA